MKRRTFIAASISGITIAAFPAQAQDAVDFGWIELLPDDGTGVARPIPLEEHDEGANALFLNDSDVPIRDDIDGLKVRMVGYVTPISFAPGSRSMKVDGFLLAPFTGVCVHVPPPPANQLVLGHYAPGIDLATRLSLDPVMVVGVLRPGKTNVDVTVAGYQLEVETMEYVSNENSQNVNRFSWGTN